MSGRGNQNRRYNKGHRNGKDGKHHGRGPSNNKRDHKKKTIEDYVFYLGSAKQASDYERTADYVINHIAKEFEYGLDIASALKELQPADKTSWEPKLKYSTATDADQKEAENRQHTMMYQSQLNAYIKRSEMYTANLVKAYALLWERCSQGLKNKIESRRDYSKIMNDPIALLKAIREHALNFQDDKFCMTIIIEALLTLVHTKQKEGESLQDYTRRFRIALEVYKSHTSGDDQAGPSNLRKYISGLTGYDKKDLKIVTEMSGKANDLLMATLYLMNADQSKYGGVLKGLYTQNALGNNQFPKTITEANNVLSRYTRQL
ncbi:hypothetical protein IV203_035190 [Nitzschia inconspicua]|uniref:Uncharacterized protein n=1 Tax=Nitzschia inconspicua TaxID=303405 RepID=A0A9K3LFU1_9STRA|nr:hypothetical protein IV203_035190 [Nitzschia inconspicua]